MSEPHLPEDMESQPRTPGRKPIWKVLLLSMLGAVLGVIWNLARDEGERPFLRSVVVFAIVFGLMTLFISTSGQRCTT